MTQITLNIEDDKLKAFIAFIKTLNYVSVEGKSNKKVKFPTMTEQQIINQAILADKEIEQGKTTSHDDFYKEFKNW